jgi:hypothetical protein
MLITLALFGVAVWLLANIDTTIQTGHVSTPKRNLPEVVTPLLDSETVAPVQTKIKKSRKKT